MKGKRNRTTLILPTWWAHHIEDAPGRVILTPGAPQLVSPRGMTQWCARIIRKAKLKRPGVNAHSFRHTYARLALEQGARLEELQRFLGHKSIRTTEQYYGWLTGDSATTLARSRIYGEGIRLVKGKGNASARTALGF